MPRKGASPCTREGGCDDTDYWVSAFGGSLNWIRIAVAIGDDPDVHRLAERLNVRVAEAVGMVVLVLARFPEHAPTGNVAQIPASLVERWAGWEGERGAFDREWRGIFLVDDVWPAWEKHNGAALRDAQAARDRAAEYRRRKANDLLNAPPNGTENGSPNGSPLRTDGRTNITTGGRKRPKPDNGPPPLPFCAECGQGMGKRDPADLKLVILHRPECSRYVVA